MNDVKKQRYKFPVGNPGGPGRPRIPDDIRDVKVASYDEVIRRFNKYVHMSLDNLDACKKDKSLAVIDHIIISIAEQAVKRGDQMRLDFVLDRLFGKQIQKLELSGAIENRVSINTSEDRLNALEKTKRLLEAEQRYNKDVVDVEEDP